MPTIKSSTMILVLANAVLLSGCSSGGPESRSKSGSQSPRSETEVVRSLLHAEVKDKLNWDRRNAKAMSHLTPSSAIPFWERLYPVTYSSEKIYLLGPKAIDALLEVINDPAE